MKLKNKIILACFLFIVILSIAFGSFASSPVIQVRSNNTYQFEDFSFSVSEEFIDYPNCIILLEPPNKEHTQYYMYMLFSSTPLEQIGENYNFSGCYRLKRIGSSSLETTLKYLKEEEFTLSNFVWEDSYSLSLPYDSVIASSQDIKNEGGEVVFQGTPLGVILMGEIQTSQEVMKKATEIVKMIIPISLGIFGTLLIIYLIRYKIFSKV